MFNNQITGVWHLYFALTLALALPHLTGCAAGCKSAQRAWEQGTKPEGGGGAHWRLEVPRAELDEQLSGAAGQVKGRRGARARRSRGCRCPSSSLSSSASTSRRATATRRASG